MKNWFRFLYLISLNFAGKIVLFELPHYFYKLHIYNTCGANLKNRRRNKQSKGLENTY